MANSRTRASVVIYGVVSVVMLAVGIFSLIRASYLLGSLALVVGLSTAVLVVLTIRRGTRP